MADPNTQLALIYLKASGANALRVIPKCSAGPEIQNPIKVESEARAGGWVAQLRVLHLNSAPQGGASRLAQSLVHAQSEIGVISEIVFGLDGSLRFSPQKAPLLTLAAGVDEYLLKKSNSNHQVSLIRSLLSGRLDENWIKSIFDVVHLHWVEGMVRRSEKVFIPAGTPRRCLARNPSALPVRE